MRGILPKAGLVLVALALLSSGATGEGLGHLGIPMTTAERQAWLDSLVDQWPNGIVPIWALHQDLSAVGERSLATGATETGLLDCPAALEIQMVGSQIAHYNEGDSLTAIVNHELDRVVRYLVDSSLSYTSDPIPVEMGGAWLAEDLDLDGSVELVMQYADILRIYSASAWQLRREFIFSGMPIEMRPVAVNIDNDPYPELYVTPNSLGGTALPTIIKYNPVSDSFEIAFQMWAPNGATGQHAVGDFDEDGRVEFISGNNLGGGYEVFEWRDTMLVHVGVIGDSMQECTAATACRPKPGGVLYALVGGKRIPGPGARYELYTPIGDNTFERVHVFSDDLFYSNQFPCLSADTDCDGLDELLMYFRPVCRVWEWDLASDSFAEDCSWDAELYSEMYKWYSVDLNHNGVPEWASLNDHRLFRAFSENECVYCDPTGQCSSSDTCACACHSDPSCDGIDNILDVVTAVSVAFRGAALVEDPFWQCPVDATDADCSGLTDVLDVVRFVNVAFRGADPEVEFCDPCL